MSYQQILDFVKRTGLDAILYTTLTHKAGYTCCRIIIDIGRECDEILFKNLTDWFIAQLKYPEIVDHYSRTCTQAIILPVAYQYQKPRVDRVLSQAGLPKVERSVRSSIIDPYLPFIVETLSEFPTLTAVRLFEMAKQRGYPGGPSQFRQRISQLRPRKQPEAYLRLKTLPGEEAQIDWGLCRARHNPHYADNRTMPSSCSH